MHTLPAEHGRMLRSFMADARTHMTNNDSNTLKVRGKNVMMFLPSSRARKMHVGI